MYLRKLHIFFIKIYYNKMKINILFIGLVLLLLGWSVHSASTVLTYIV